MKIMMKDSRSGFLIADCSARVIPAEVPEKKDLDKALNPLILSASGWRKIFAANGADESDSPEINMADRILVAAMARVYSRFLKGKCGSEKPEIFLGMDSRPTGPLMADIMLRVFMNEGLRVRPLFIVSAPEIMAACGQDPHVDGFAYISASHNPLGHNGVKFGLSEGGVIGGEDSRNLIQQYRDFLMERKNLDELCSIHSDVHQLEALHSTYRENKQSSYRVYLDFARQVASGDPQNTQEYFDDLKKGLEERPLGILGELNGSARSLGPDREYLEELGVKVQLINDIPRQIVHPIVPEGASLDLCRRELEELHRQDSSYILGYVPDCDGDRGNLVYYSRKHQEARILQAQEVFALSVLSELTQLQRKGDKKPAAVAVNGPTSLRIDRIAELSGAEVFRAEVGEANVVNLAEKLRRQGYAVPILGEGSNGGNITHPARVRDPLNTLSALIALLCLRDSEKKPGLFSIWCRQSGREELCRGDYGMDEILESLPDFLTTSAFEDRALMHIKSESHAILKKRFEDIFRKEWEEKKKWLTGQWDIYGWKSYNTEGIEEKEGFGPEFRSGAETGGLKILFQNRMGQDCAFIWMRGSGTEPVFRIMADSSLDYPEREAFLLNWLRCMVEQADHKR